MADKTRPSPDALLRAAQREARGRLKIFLGAAPGVGKTFEMLSEGAERQRDGIDLVAAVVETHGRAETEALVAPLEVVARRQLDYQGHALDEMDIDAVLARAPQLALVDELAHSNVAGSRHPKRWQDVVELLDAGINVYTTLNIQHVESLNDVVASFTRVRVRETVPDSIFDGAEIEVVDLPPDELIERLQAGKVYVPAEATRALGHFFSKSNLSALREMALRRAALSVDQAMLEHLDSHAVPGTFAGGERVLVAVNELPGADRLVRAAKRLADALRAPWQAIYVETPRAAGFDEAQKRRVGETLQLAAGLGATIATVPAENVIAGLTEQIAAGRITQLVIGKSVRSWWFELRHGSVVDAMLRSSDELAVHVIPASTRAVAAPVPKREWGRWTEYAAALALVALTTAIAKAIEPWFGVNAVDLLYLLPVILTSRRYALWPGLAAAVAAGLAYNFFFLPPLYTFTIADPQSVLTMFVLIAIAAFSAELTGRLRTRASIGARSAQENAAVAAFGQALARASDWESTSRLVCEEMSRLLDVSAILLDRRDGELVPSASCPDEHVALTPIDQAAADWTWSRGEPAGAGTATLTSADWQFRPLKTTLGVLAVVGLSRPDGEQPVGADRAVLLSTLVGQAALAHERLRLEDQVREVSLLKERDRLRAALLSSIGHDLRTPLTAVGGAVDAIATLHPNEPAVTTARAELARLRRFLENLLEMVRFDTGAVVPAIEPVDLVDATGAALDDLRDLLPDERVDLRVPTNLPLVRADPRLLHHVLLNLIGNAAIHGGGKVTIIGERQLNAATLSIADQGPGLPAKGGEELFTAFVRGTGSDKNGGSGLGLEIARAFASAMQITISASNQDSGGAVFKLTFPSVDT